MQYIVLLFFLFSAAYEQKVLAKVCSFAHSLMIVIVKRTSALLVFWAVLSMGCLAQKNVIKTKPLRMLYGIASPSYPIPINLAYERVVARKLSLSLNLIYGPQRELRVIREMVNDLSEFDDMQASVSSFATQRFYISPELRFYPAIAEKAPHGFFLSFEPFYSTTGSAIDLEHGFETYFTVNDRVVTYMYNNSYDVRVTSSNIGASMGLGSQWVLAERVSLEVLWIGIGAGAATIIANHEGELIDKEKIEADIEAATGEQYSIPEDQVPTWETVGDALENDFEEFYMGILISGDRIKTDTRPDGITFTYTGIFPRLRLLNFSVGIAF